MAKPQERTYGIGTTLMWASLGAVGAGLLTYALFVPWYAIGFTYSLARREHAILFGVLDAVTYMIVPAGCGIASGVLSWGLWKRGEPRTKAWKMILAGVVGGLLFAAIGYLLSSGLQAVTSCDDIEPSRSKVLWRDWLRMLPFVTGGIGAFFGCGALFGILRRRGIWRYSLPALGLVPISWGLMLGLYLLLGMVKRGGGTLVVSASLNGLLAFAAYYGLVGALMRREVP